MASIAGITNALTAIEAKLRAISPELEDVISVLKVIQGATSVGGDSAAMALDVVAAALKAIDDHAAGAITHEQLVAQIDKAHDAIASDRAAEDAAP